MDSEEIKKAISEVKEGKAIILDVRRQDEWDDSHAKGATWLPSEQILVGGVIPDIPKDAIIYTYCHGGGRAGRVKTALTDKGFTNVKNLGGLVDWENAGGVVEK